MKKIYYIFLLTGIISITSAYAQEEIFSFQYSMGFGSGNTKDFVNTASFRGLSLEYRHLFNPHVGVGIESGWNVFYERRSYDTYTKGAQSLSGIQYRYMNTVPILGAIDYYFQPDAKFNPFIGLGVGTLYSSQRVDMGIFSITDDAWQFALRPEVGVLINANTDLDLIVAVKYFNGFKTSGFDEQSYFSLNLGFVFK